MRDWRSVVANEVGLIGVGLLGSAIAARLLEEGVSVCGFDVDGERIRWLTQHGGTAGNDLRALAARCSRIVLALPDSQVVRSVIAELRAALRPGTLILDTTTGAPRDAEQAAATLAAIQVDYAEVTIAGSSAQVQKREALAIIGANPSLLPQIMELTNCWSSHSVLVGAPGQAARMKLVVNLALGLNRVVLAEALAFAAAEGLDEGLALDVLRSSPAYSQVMDSKGPKMLSRDYTPQARLRQHLKDVRLILDEAKDLGLTLPLSELHRKLLEKAIELNLGELDNSAIRLVYPERGTQS